MKIAIIAFFLAYLLLVPTHAYARSGCCSWHGGVCGYSCCDGSPLSYVCGGGGFYYPPVYYSPAPQAPAMTAEFTYLPNDDGTFNVKMDWNESPYHDFSVAMNNYAGGDPGPTSDTTLSEYTFENISPGTQYANMKVLMNGYWSNVVYWTITVPEWYPPEPTEEPTETSSNNSTEHDTTTEGLVLLGATPFLGYGLYKFLKPQ